MAASSGVAATSLSFSFRPPEPLRPAAELLADIRERGGRVFRMRLNRVCCLTDSPEVAEWLVSLGANGFGTGTPKLKHQPPGAFYRAMGKVEFDLWIERIPVADGETVWEAAA